MPEKPEAQKPEAQKPDITQPGSSKPQSRADQSWRSLQMGSLAGLVLGGLGFIWLGWTYDQLKTASLQTAKAWVEVEAAMEQRNVLIGQLLQVTLAATPKRDPALQNLANARQVWRSTQTIPDKVEADARLELALAQVRSGPLVRSSALQANPLFQHVATAVADIDYVLQGDRQRYNAEAQAYNQALEAWPTRWIASGLGFQPQPLFDPRVVPSANPSANPSADFREAPTEAPTAAPSPEPTVEPGR